MTIRDHLGPRLRWIVALTYAGLGLSLAGIIVGLVVWQHPVQALVLPGVAVALVAWVAGCYVCLWCPRCRGNLGPMLLRAGLRGLAWRMRFCPYCGTGLDDELPAKTEGDLL